MTEARSKGQHPVSNQEEDTAVVADETRMHNAADPGSKGVRPKFTTTIKTVSILAPVNGFLLAPRPTDHDLVSTSSF